MDSDIESLVDRIELPELERPLVRCQCDAPFHSVRPCRGAAIETPTSPPICTPCLFSCQA